MSTPVTLVPGNMPPAWCYSTPQDLLDTLVNNITAYISGTANGYNYGPNTPNADQRDRFWRKTDPNYNAERDYDWSTQYSLWLALHPIPPGMVWMTSTDITAPFLDTFDGGSAGAVTATSGPMWEKYTAMDNRSPMAPGLWSDAVTTLALGGTAGEQRHTITAAELPPHAHEQSRDNADTDVEQVQKRLYSGGHYHGVNNPLVILDGGPTNTPANVVHPVLGINFIRRTARLYYRAI